MDDTPPPWREPGPDRPDLPQKSEPASAAENRLAAGAWPVAFDLAGAAITVDVADETPPDLNGFMRMALRIDDQPAALFIAPSLFQDLVTLIDREVLNEGLDGKVKALLLEAGLASALERLEAALGWRVALEQVHPAQDRKAIDLFWATMTVPGGKEGDVGFSLPPSHLDQLSALLGPAADASPPRAPLPLSTPLAFRVGSMVLDLADLRSLRPGDIVLVDESLLGTNRLAVVGAGDRWLFDAVLDDVGVTLASDRRSPHSQDRDVWLMDNLNPDQGDRSAEDHGDDRADDGTVPPALDDLPIKLLFEIGQVEVSLGELGALGPGHVFDLDKALHRSVDIRAAGRRIGKGEIVEIDGRIGVRIGRLFDHA